MKKKFGVIFLGVILSLLLGCGSVNKESITKAAENRAVEHNIITGNTNGNISSGGIAATDVNNVYFSDMRHLYKQPINGGKSVLIDSSKTKYEWINSLNAINNAVYYINGSQIYKYSGGKKIPLTKNKNVLRMLVVGDKIFFISHETVGYKARMNVLFSSDLNGKNLKTVSEKTDDVFNIFYYDNKLYFTQSNVSTGDVLCEMDLKTKESKARKIMTINGNYLNVEGGWVYYRKSNTEDIFRKRLIDGTEEEILKIYTQHALPNITKDNIYYSVNIGTKTKYIKNSLADGISTSMYEDTVQLNGYDWVYGYFSIVNNKMYYVSNIYDFNSKVKVLNLNTSNTTSNQGKNVTIDEAKEILKKLDTSFNELVIVDNGNTVANATNIYSKNYYMFLVNYGEGDNSYTSDRMYLVKKDTGEAFFMAPDMVLHILKK